MRWMTRRAIPARPYRSAAREFNDVRIVKDAVELEMLRGEDGWERDGRSG